MAAQTIPRIGPKARGAFGPKPGETLSPLVRQKLEDAAFMRVIKQRLIGGCGDERLDERGNRLLLPVAFGGLYSLVIADALSPTPLWYQKTMTTQDHAVEMTKRLRSMYPDATLCVHTDDTHTKGDCGCAAIALAHKVLELLVEPAYASMIPEPAYHKDIVANAKNLLAGNYFQPGTTSQLVNELETHNVKKEVLTGSHEGVLFIDNRREGTVIDRPALYAWCREQGLPVVWAFEYDRWAMASTANVLMPNQAAEKNFFAAGDAFNRAVQYTIFNQHMPVLTLS